MKKEDTPHPCGSERNQTPTTMEKGDDDEQLRPVAGGAGGGGVGLGLLVIDFVLAFMWVCSGALIKVLVYPVLGLEEAAKCCFSVANMFFFAWLGHFTGGGSYNPLTVLSSAISGDFLRFLFTVFGRVPAQMVGSIIGVKMIVESFPYVGRGPHLNVDIHQGAVTEGLLSFMIVIVSLGLKRKDPKSFFMKTWISSISKLSLHILGSDLTGGCMNPASALGWAYARGDHITKAHLLVYCLAPMEATLLAVWVFSLVAQPQKHKVQEETSKKNKAD